jgi:hemerythrin-like metal-binding protein
MALFAWKEDYSVSVKRFDGEHKKLFSLLNELSDAIAKGQGRLVVRNVLQQLTAYTREHFAAEEAAMRAAAFDGLPSHVAEHRELTEKVEKFSADYSKGDTSITNEVLYFLCDWLEHHILSLDRKYGESLSRAGIC